MNTALDLAQPPVRTQAAEDLRTLAWLHAGERDAGAWLGLGTAGFPGGLMLLGPAEHHVCAYFTRALRLLIDDVLTDTRAADDRLAADYAAIYLTHALRASPCESVWRDDEHLMMQGPTFAVRRWYRDHGVAVAPGDDAMALPDDHLAHELGFCAHLVERGDLPALRSFLDQHLMQWLPQFAQRVAERADTPVYAGLAVLTEAACQRLRRMLDEEAGPTVQQ